MRARETPEQANIAGVLTFDEARRIAVNVAKLPVSLGAKVMAEIYKLTKFRKVLREQLAADIINASRNPDTDAEVDRLLEGLHKELERAVLSREEIILALYMLLVQTLADTDDNERQSLARQMRDLLRHDLVEAAVDAFRTDAHLGA
jgi:hypothetical protein